MSAGLKGDLSKLRRIEQGLRELPRVIAQEVATATAGTITKLARSTFERGENAYGDAWAPGADGQRVTLHKSGGIASGVRYVATGTRLRAQLGVSYARYQIGRRPVFPRGGASLPTSYAVAIRHAAAAVIARRLGR